MRSLANRKLYEQTVTEETNHGISRPQEFGFPFCKHPLC